MITESTYDTKSNPLTGKTRDSASAKVIATATAYTTDQNYVATQTDARGKTVTTVTDPDTGTVTSVTDAGGQAVTYTYDAMKRVTGTSAVVGSKTILSQSTYTHDLLTETAHNTTLNTIPAPGTAGDTTVRYQFGYDAQHCPTTVSVGGHLLSTKVYNNTAGNASYGTLTRVEYTIV